MSEIVYLMNAEKYIFIISGVSKIASTVVLPSRTTIWWPIVSLITGVKDINPLTPAIMIKVSFFIGFIFALVVSFCFADIGSGVLFNPCTTHIRFVVFSHFRSPFSAGRSRYTTFFECV
jgi:ABC-type transporter Mla maintaining outer membrane lipid asymmetry permease subunit MlaE